MVTTPQVPLTCQMHLQGRPSNRHVSGLQTADLQGIVSRPGYRTCLSKDLFKGVGNILDLSNWQILTNKLAHFEQFRYYMTISCNFDLATFNPKAFQIR